MNGLRDVAMEDPEQGPILLTLVIPRDDDSWGVLAPLRDTSWGPLIPAVSGESLSHALHGWATPLVREWGVDPLVLARRVHLLEAPCRLLGDCIGYKVDKCLPGKHVPECYEAPFEDDAISRLASIVAIRWREGRRVLRVIGPEFSIQ